MRRMAGDYTDFWLACATAGPILLIPACLGFVALGYVGLVLIRAQNRDKKLNERIVTATSPHLRQRKQETRSLTRTHAEHGARSHAERLEWDRRGGGAAARARAAAAGTGCAGGDDCVEKAKR